MKRLLALAAGSLLLAGASAHALRLPGAPKCPVFPATNAWNQRVDTLPVAANSAQLDPVDRRRRPGCTPTSARASTTARPIGIPFNVVSKKTPRSASRSTTPTNRDKGPYPIPADGAHRGRPASDGDRHALLARPGRVQALRALRALPEGRRAGTPGSGAIWNLSSNALRPAGWTSADAAGLPIFPGLARYDEVARGAIDHALRFTVSRTRKRVRLSGAALRVVVRRPVAAADGPARAAEGVRRHLGLPEAGADRAPGDEDATG